MKVKIGYKLWGSIVLDLNDLNDESAHDKLLELSVKTLIQNIEGMPHDIEGDAIEVISIEPLEEGEE
jgi:hypothetical protein